MPFPSRKQKIILAGAVYICVVILSVSLHILKQDSLRFHPRDYNYFVEQAARLTDPRLADRFAMQIEGYNFIGLQGVEGVKSLYHAVHTEYFRYLYVLLYGIFADPLALYILYSLVFFLPILYFAVLPHPHNRQHAIILLLFALLYLVFPATLNAATADLRSRVLFIAAWCLVILSIYFERPFWEKSIWFLLLIGIREEGAVLGAIAILLNHLSLRGRPGRWMQTVTFTIMHLAGFILFLAFMRWGGFTRVDSAYDPLNFLRLLPAPFWIAILALGALIVFALWTAWKKAYPHFWMVLFLSIYSLAVLLSGFQWLRDTLRWYIAQSQVSSVSFLDIVINATTNEMTALVFYILMMVGVVLWEYSRGASRKLLISAYAVLIVSSSLISLLYYPPLLAEWKGNIAPARLVRDFAATHDRYATQVLLDYDTYQAFYNYDQVIVYNRLPVWDTLPEKRYYPENKSALVKQIQQGMDFAVISRGSLENILELADLAQVPVAELAGNDRYVILQFHPPP